MPEESSVSQWIEDLKAGSVSAAEKLWRRYYTRIVRLAQRELNGAPRRTADEDDVAQLAFYDLCEGAREQRFAALHGRDSLWRLIATITKCKAHNQMKAARCKKRAKEVGESALPDSGASDQEGGLNAIAGPLPVPDVAARMTESVEELLSLLDKAGEHLQLRAIALARLEGFDNQEIAQQLGLSQRTVERRVQMVRRIWEHKAPQ